jgi:hypothetical protein
MSEDAYNEALIVASGNGHTEVVEALLAAGADVNARDNDGNSSLIFAATFGNTEIVQALLDFQPQDDQPGLDVNARDNYGYSALIWAAFKGHTETIQALLAVPGIDVSATNNNGSSALTLASDDEIRQLLIERENNNVTPEATETTPEATETTPEAGDEHTGGKTRKLRLISKYGGRTKHRKRHVKKSSCKHRKSRGRKSKKNRF